MKKGELIFIPSPVIGHLPSTVEVGKLIVSRDDRLSITFLITEPRSFDSKLASYIESLVSSTLSNRLQFIKLPCLEPTPSEHPLDLGKLIEGQKPQVKKQVTKLIQTQNGPQLAGFVIDMFGTSMIDLANEFEVPTYLYLTSGATFLGVVFHLQSLHDEQNVDITEFDGSDAHLELPVLANPVPAKVLPTPLLNKYWQPSNLAHARRFREAKGIIVNTFMELEPLAVNSLLIPPVYPVGPILNLKSDSAERTGEADKKSEIMKWLDDQPPSSVVFLCFGSLGSFGADQVKEIACALELSGHRFIWSLQQTPPQVAAFGPSTGYTNLVEILPQGFVDRTAETGKIIGWAPQVAILSHTAIGGFVSHCGWNSTLESIWFGVPIAAWPMYGEQQLNAFQMVVELGLAVEIKMDYKRSFMDKSEGIVSFKEIERGITSVMEHDSEVRKKMKKMSESSRFALMEFGSSYSNLGRLISEFVDNIS
ncbi:anthocyanidin 3-O-glucosyltransferase 6-like [Tripterygium wilfordii]|uniref:anthocyanidin 3-O-glucosyltransferase 6-like n=1 Tax=Tripterygium wilfordii TaxID=458696 RepID=UPI0018F81948|nr:anthocyanidin 3-O-glucosyltransferase 6-like [Tripterygium wilfordii]XP_038725998.1 anthocyanidin 3-O-glucosyltransferase 6-like [Tripterygium wilfordii]